MEHILSLYVRDKKHCAYILLKREIRVAFGYFSLEICDEDVVDDKHGETRIRWNVMRIRKDVYQGAVDGKGRDRMTLAHEVGHLLLHTPETISLCQRSPGRASQNVRRSRVAG